MEEITYSIEKGGQTITRKLSDVISPKDLYSIGKTNIITLAGTQKICDFEGIVEKDIRTEVTPLETNRQQHVVNIWVGFKGDNDRDNWKRASGEASMLNTGKQFVDKSGARKYDEYQTIDSKYRYAMADKRAFNRAVLKFIRCYNVYSEVESPDFSPAQNVSGHDY